MSSETSTAKAPRRRVGRRVLIGSVLGLTVGVPAVGVLSLKLQDNPLPRVKAPDMVFVDGWLLDADDIKLNE
ncbi:MAG: hypothetical protein AAGB10_18860 [Pseudomonadota bacterium]